MSQFEIDKYKFSSSPALTRVGDDIIEERGKEAILFSKDLNKKGIIVKDLIIKSPSLKIRNKLLNISKYIVSSVELFEEFSNTDKLPVDKIAEEIKINRNIIEQWQDYITAYIYLFSNPDYKNLSDYLRIEENIDLMNLESVKDSKDEVSYVLADTNSGIAVARSSKSAIILTSQGEFKRLGLQEKCKLGEEVHGKEKKSLKKHKFEIIIISALVLSLAIVSIYKYIVPSTTLIINTTSEFTIEVNSYNKIIRIKSQTEKGKELISDINILDTDIDEGLLKFFEYVHKNEMIPNDKILITIVGEKLPYGTILNTEKFLKQNDINYQVNNGGLETGRN